MLKKKKILLNWWYDRKDLMAPFMQLREDAELVLIYYKQRGEHEELPLETKYWADYSSPYQLLDEVQPDEVVFFNIDDGTYQVSLNMACRQRGIPTTICDHGLRAEIIMAPPKLEYDSNKLQAVIFLLACLRPGNLGLLPKLLKLMRYKLAASSEGMKDPALRELRLANRYICYTKANAQYFTERDKVDFSKVQLIGNPGLDQFFQQTAAADFTKEPYFLLIDQPFVRNKFNNDILTLEQKNEFLLKLAIFCGSRKHKLYVKLHPDDYQQDYFLVHPDIVYLRQADLTALIHGSSGVFGFYSTLMLPALCFKKCYLFRINENPIQRDWEEIGIARMVNFFTFTPEQLDFEHFQISDEVMQRFLDNYIYKTDGQSLERLRSYMLN